MVDGGIVTKEDLTELRRHIDHKFEGQSRQSMQFFTALNEESAKIARLEERLLNTRESLKTTSNRVWSVIGPLCVVVITGGSTIILKLM